MAQCPHCRAKMANGSFKCLRCKQWNFGPGSGMDDDGTLLLGDVPEQDVPRLRTGPWDVNFGSPPGLPNGAVVILGGEPGVGKSTIALQWCAAIAMAPENFPVKPVLYLGAEENARQVKNRAVRLGSPGLSDRVRILPLERMADASLDKLLQRPLAGMVVDSIPGFTNDPEQAVELVKAFKLGASRQNMAVVVINHITKGGDMAGLMKLQHAGDISLLMTKLEDDMDLIGLQDETIRILGAANELVPRVVRRGRPFNVIQPRTLETDKSRFGPSGVETHYAMAEQGLVEVTTEERWVAMLAAEQALLESRGMT